MESISSSFVPEDIESIPKDIDTLSEQEEILYISINQDQK